MSIKQSIAALVILLSVSFSAFASSKYIKVISVNQYANGCISVGQIYNMNPYLGNYYISGVCSGIYIRKGIDSEGLHASVYSSSLQAYSTKGYYKDIGSFEYVESCPDGTLLNPNTGQCEPSK
ncbi:hypothetical protein HKB24_04555, partial [Vibrio parahaemolyticus]|nr:hypothetical protein [Vibrio parahaemolyticus]